MDLNEVISAAVSEAKAESGDTSETVATTPEAEVTETPATEPAADPAPTTAKVDPVAKAEEPDEEFFNPTAEDLALIEANPALKKAYKALRKGFTEKTTAIATERKELKERAELAGWIQENPEKAARRLAELSGLTITEARAEVREAKETATAVTDDLTKMWKDSIGDDAAPILRPVIEATARAVIEKILGPIKAQTEELTTAAQRRAFAASVAEFGSTVTQRGEEWDTDIQADMAALTHTVTPSSDASVDDYLSNLYDAVMMRRSRTHTARSNLARLRKIRDEQEPNVPARPTVKSEERITNDMSDKDAVALAVRAAQREMAR
jgi:hypothetical protein